MLPALLTGYGIIVAGYLGLAWWVAGKRAVERTGGRLGGLALAGAVVTTAQGLLAAGLGASLPAGAGQHLPLYWAMGLAAMLVVLGGRLARSQSQRTRWIWIVPVMMAGLLALDLGALPVRGEWVLAGIALVWAGLVAVGVRATLRHYRRSIQPLHRNRLAFWAMALAALVLGTALAAAGWTVVGSAGLLGALTLAVVTLLHPHLPDARRAVYQGWASLVVAAVAVLVYGAWLALTAGAAALLPRWSPWLVYGMSALLLVMGVQPGLSWLTVRLRQRLNDRRYQPRQIVGEYSLSISNILELDRLASVALGLVQEVFGADQAALYIVDPEGARDDEQVRLVQAGSLSERAPAAGTLPLASPLVGYLRSEYAPVTQYDLDLDPRFADLGKAERVWLGQLSMDVYVPIYAHRDWIGLLALGPKRSRHQYFPEDLELLSTLADQTAVALQNARLVTDLVRVNRDLQTAYGALNDANQRLGQIERTKSDFISVISHELRTPLAILFGYAQILLDELGKKGEEEHRQLVEGMTTGVTRLNEVIENMLDMAKIDSRSLQIHPQPVYIEHLAQKLAWQLQWALNERNLTLQTLGLSELPPVEGDSEALYKALHHLVVNAVKYTPDGGTITVSARCDPVLLPGGAVEVSVSDTGIGIDPRFLELIFDKFYQTGSAAQHSTGKTKFKGGGPGLGLAIARGIIEAHGGKLRAESAGHDETLLPGSRFILLIPLRQRNSGTTAIAPPN